MLAIKILQDGNVRDVHGELHENIITICHEHRKANRALAFAFILFNYGHPNIKKMLDDKDYLRALHEKSGRYLTVFYIPQDEQFFGEDINNDRREVRHMAPLNSENQLAILLSSYMKTAEAIKLPAVLFFQVNGESISDWFVIGLDENKIEDSFVELYDYVKSAVSQLSDIKQENYKNSNEIFALLKQQVQGTRLKKQLSKNMRSFPIQLLTRWIIGKSY